MAEKELSFKEIMESRDYHSRKEELRRDINDVYVSRRFSPHRFATPGEFFTIDRSEFRKSDEEKGILFTLMAQTKKTKLKTYLKATF